MRMFWILAAGVLLTGCEKSAGPAATAPATPGQAIEQHLDAAGQEIRSAATEAETQAAPLVNEAREKTREEIHNTAEKVAGWTAASQPATQPAIPPTTHPNQ